jgi:O-antigen ligase
LSCSRAVFWGLIVFTVVAVATAAAYRTIRTKVALIAIAGTLGALGLVLATENVFYPGVAGAYAGQQTSQARSTEGRLAIWKRSADIFKLSPVWGVGAGNAPLFLTSSADQEETTGFASRTFSLPIQVLTEKGVIGAALYLAVLVLAGWEAHRRLRNPKVSPQVKALTCCLVAGVVAVLFRELTYSSLLEHAATAMLFTMCLALLAAEEPA